MLAAGAVVVGRVGRVGRLAGSGRLVSSTSAARLRFWTRALALSPLVAGASVEEEGEGSPRSERVLAVRPRCSPPAALPLEVDALLVLLLSLEGREGGVRTFEQRWRLRKQESQRWRLLLTTQVGLLRMMQLVQRSSPVKVWFLDCVRLLNIVSSGGEDSPLNLGARQVSSGPRPVGCEGAR